MPVRCLMKFEVPPLKRCFARESGIHFVYDHLPDWVVTSLRITCPSHRASEIFDVDSLFETAVPTGVIPENTDLLHAESNLRTQRSGSAPSRSAMQRSMKIFGMQQEVKQEASEIDDVLPAQ